MSGPISHHLAGGIHPGAFVQATAPDTSDVQDGVLWADTSSGPPYQLSLWDASSATWRAVGAAANGALLWDAEHGTWTYAALDDVFALLSADIADASHGPYLHLTQGGELRFQVDPLSGLYVAVTYHEDGTFDGSGANIQGGLQVINSLARLSHQKSILQLVDLNTLEVVDQMIANGAFYLIGPHNRPNTDYQLDSGGTLQWTGASHPPTGVLALDGGEDVYQRAARLGVLNAAAGPDNDVLWALCADTYGSLTTPAVDAHPGQVLGYIAPLAPDTHPRLAPSDGPASVALMNKVPISTDCTQRKCGAAIAMVGNMQHWYDWFSSVLGFALNQLGSALGTLIVTTGSAFLDAVTDGAGLVLSAEEAALADLIVKAIPSITGGILQASIGSLSNDTVAALQQTAFCALACEGSELGLSAAQMGAWQSAIAALPDSAFTDVLQRDVLAAIALWGAGMGLAGWQEVVLVGGSRPSTDCDAYTCP